MNTPRLLCTLIAFTLAVIGDLKAQIEYTGTIDRKYTQSGQSIKCSFRAILSETQTLIEILREGIMEKMLVNHNGEIQIVLVRPDIPRSGELNRSEVRLYSGDRPINEPEFELIWFALKPKSLGKFEAGSSFAPGLFFFEKATVSTNRTETGEEFDVTRLEAIAVDKGGANARSAARVELKHHGGQPVIDLTPAATAWLGLMQDDGKFRGLTSIQVQVNKSSPINHETSVVLDVEGRGLATDYRFLSERYPRPLRYPLPEGRLPATNDPMILSALRSSFPASRKAAPLIFWIIASALVTTAAAYALYPRKQVNIQ